MSKFIRNRSLLKGGRRRLEWMGGKPSSNFTDPLPESSPDVPLSIFETGTRFSSSISSQTLPNSLLALTQKLTNISFKILVNAHLKLLVCGHIWIPCWNYRKIPKISPSMYKPAKLVTQKTLCEIAPPNISPPGTCTWKIALKYKVKRRKNGKFPSNYKLARSTLKRKLPSVHQPLRT